MSLALPPQLGHGACVVRLSRPDNTVSPGPPGLDFLLPQLGVPSLGSDTSTGNGPSSCAHTSIALQLVPGISPAAASWL